MDGASSNNRRGLHILPIGLLALSVILLFLVPRLWPRLWERPIASTAYVTAPSGKKATLDGAQKSGWIIATPLPTNEGTVHSFKNLTADKLHVVIDKANSEKPAAIEIQPGQTVPIDTTGLAVVVSTNAKLVMPIVLTVVLLVGGLFVILAKRFESSDRHWAYVTIGTIVGYWLKG
jgi:hypothetical protein